MCTTLSLTLLRCIRHSVCTQTNCTSNGQQVLFQKGQCHCLWLILMQQSVKFLGATTPPMHKKPGDLGQTCKSQELSLDGREDTSRKTYLAQSGAQYFQLCLCGDLVYLNHERAKGRDDILKVEKTLRDLSLFPQLKLEHC